MEVFNSFDEYYCFPPKNNFIRENKIHQDKIFKMFTNKIRLEAVEMSW